jgi:hypothetical protein
MNTQNLFLQNNLKKFGLNPTDWKIQRIRSSHYKIANVRDENFYFLGEATQTAGLLLWSQIKLASF